MRKNLHRLAKRILCLLIVVCMGSSACIALAVSKETQDEINRVKREKAKAEEEKRDRAGTKRSEQCQIQSTE